MNPILLIDFGSTYTKTTVVDPKERSVLANAQSFTTVDTDIGHGLSRALSKLNAAPEDFSEVYACSSAAGGLRMMVSGLMPELTSKAAQMAALGAGAKVIHNFSHELTREDLQTIEEAEPDIFLLCGGTDGGNRRCIETNAKQLSTVQKRFPILYAGNRQAKDACAAYLKDKEVIYCANVLPALDVIRIDEVQEAIRTLFQERIVQGKGLSRMNTILSRIAMPTPSAVQKGLELLSKGTKEQKGIGELIGIDLGGATTDVYSMTEGRPQADHILLKSLPEPYSKRTVEGDLGMRYSVEGIVDAAGFSHLSESAGIPEEQLTKMLQDLSDEKSMLPSDPAWEALDFALAKHAVSTAVRRHAGRLEEVYTPHGRQYLQTGKDLRQVRTVVLTGGALLNTDREQELIADCLYKESDPFTLLPEKVRILKDSRYILSAAGVLSMHDPDAAFEILTKELTDVRDGKS